MIKLIRVLAVLTVAAVAGIAGIVSFGHIRDLALAHGQTPLASALTPLSVDGLILAASLVLLHEALSGRGSPWLGRAMLALGVGATVAANAAEGAASGTLGMAIAAWPALAFIGAAEMLLLMVRSAHAEPATAQDGTGAEPQDSEVSARALARSLGISRRKAARKLGQAWAGPEPVSQGSNGHRELAPD